MIAPVEWICLDLETGNGRPDTAEAAMRVEWSPDERWKPETIGTRFKEALEKKRQRLALLATAPIVSFALKTAGELVCFHALRLEAPRAIAGATAWGCGDERSMLLALRQFLDTRAGPETLLCGHNVCSFDLPHARLAYLRHGLQLPLIFANDDQPVFDTMKVFTRRFYVDAQPMLSLDETLGQVGLQSHKTLCDGGDVPGLVAAGRVEEIVTYNLLDVSMEAELFLRLSGRSTQLS